MIVPEEYQIWEHKESGRYYEIICLTNEAAVRDGWVVQVVYEDEAGNKWSRPLTEFVQRFKLT